MVLFLFLVPTSCVFKFFLAFIATALVTGENMEYLCRNNTERDFAVTVLRADCEKITPRAASHFLDGLRQWCSQQSPFSIDLRLVDTCGESAIVAKEVTESVIYSQSRQNNGTCSVYRPQPTNNIGFISDMRVDSGEIADLLNKSDTPFLITSDMDPVSSSSAIIATGYSLQLQVKIMVNLMVELMWDYVDIVYSEDAIGRESLRIIQNILPEYHICVAKNHSVSYSSAMPALRSTGVVYLGSEGIGLHIISQIPSDTVWVVGFNITGSSITNENVYSVVRNVGDPLTDAVVYFGHALNETANQLNCEEGKAQQCVSMPGFHSRLLSNIRAQTTERGYSIAENGEVNKIQSRWSSIYNVHQNTRPRTLVANISAEGVVSTEPDFKPSPSLCNSDVNCRTECGSLHEDDHFYIHGDHIILVSLEIHEKVDEEKWWKCSGFSTRALMRTEAAAYAFTYLNDHLTPLPGVTIGMLVIDSCASGLKAASATLDALRGIRKICNKEGQCFNHKNVVAFIGDYSSDVSKQIQPILKEIPIIQMSFGASSIIFDDRVEYPYFLRTNPSDVLQAHFMVELLKKINQQAGSHINAVNLIYSEGVYGENAAKSVKASLKKANICVHLERKFVKNSKKNSFEQIVKDFAADRDSENSDVKLIVVFIDTTDIDGLMAAIRASSELWMSKNFRFIFSDTWNDDKTFFDKYGDIVKGGFTFKFTSNFNSTTFSEHLKSIHPSRIHDRNPWLSTIISIVGKCKMRGDFHHGEFSKPCNATRVDLTEFADESYLLHLMKAITATVYGLRSIALDNSRSLFDKKSIAERYQKLLDVKIPNSLEGESKSQNPFTKTSDGYLVDGNGREGYTIYQIGESRYKQLLQTGFKIDGVLGKFEEGTVLNFYIKQNEFNHGITSTTTECSQADVDEPVKPLETAVIVLSTLITIMILGFVIHYFICKCRKQRKKSRGFSNTQNAEVTAELDMCTTPHTEVRSPNDSNNNATPDPMSLPSGETSREVCCPSTPHLSGLQMNNLKHCESGFRYSDVC